MKTYFICVAHDDPAREGDRITKIHWSIVCANRHQAFALAVGWYVNHKNVTIRVFKAKEVFV